MPATLLTRLAVSKFIHKQGFGTYLVYEAMMHTLAAGEHSASAVLLVDAIDENAIRFYEKCGFKRLHSDALRLFISTKDIRKLEH